MKGRSAYFVFSEEHRQAVRNEIISSKEQGAKVSVAEVAKFLGAKWKALSEEDREVYKQKALLEQVHKESGEDIPEEGGADRPDVAMESKESSPLDGLLPLSNIKKIMMADQEVKRVSHDAVVAVAAAADMLLGLLAKQMAINAKGQKRKTLQLKDFVQAVKQDRRIAQAGLRDIEAVVSAAAKSEAASKAEKEAGRETEREAAADARRTEKINADEGIDAGDGEGTILHDDQDIAEDEGMENNDPDASGVKNKPLASSVKNQKPGGKGSKKKKEMVGMQKIGSFFTKQV